MSQTKRKFFFALPASIFLALFIFAALPATSPVASAADIKHSPLFEVSLQNTLNEFEAKERGEYTKLLNDAVTEKADDTDIGDTETTLKVQLAYSVPGVPSVPSIPKTPTPVPSYTSSYSCGTTCGSTCGATCTSTCTYTCGSTCGSTCAGSSTCIGSSTCAGSSTCMGSSTCVGSNTCVGMSSCAGSATCFGSSTCVGTTTCVGTSTCAGSSTCIGFSTCAGSVTCTFGNSCANPSGSKSSVGSSSNGVSSEDPPASDPIPETPKIDPPAPDPLLPETPDPSYASGVQPSEWAMDEVYEAIDYDFVPIELQNNYQSNITRREFCTLVIHFIEEILSVMPELDRIMDMDPGVSPFTDINDRAVTQAYYLNIVNGVGDGRFNPDGYITRQEAAVMLTNMVENFFGLDTWASASSFYDAGQIASWAALSVDFVFDNDIMSGVGNNNFGPQSLYTREQSIVTILRTFEMLIDY